MTDVAADQADMLARIQLMQEETRKFAAEQHKLSAEANKLSAEANKLSRDYLLAGWQLVITGMTAGAALVGATAVFIKIFG